jgi:hypothetical protein
MATRRTTSPLGADMDRFRAKTVPSHEQIATRAYELFLERGASNGHDLEDWLTAEHELAEARRELAAV